jgi:hypothetical protein
MKKIVAFIFFAVMLSCSSSDDDVTPVSVLTPTLQQDFLVIDQDTVAVQGTNYFFWNDNYYQVEINAAPHTIDLKFDKYGNLMSMYASVMGEGPDALHWENYAYYSSNYFNFEVGQIAPQDHACTINFSGNLYRDRFDLNSDAKTIDGRLSLSVPMLYNSPDWIANKGLHANVNGTDWFSDEPLFQTFENNTDFTNVYFVSDDQYRLVFNLSGTQTVNGVYDFAPTTLHNCIKAEKFNISTLQYEPLPTTGTMQITDKMQAFEGIFYLTGTFSLTATDSETAQTIHFGSGIFNGLHYNSH